MLHPSIESANPPTALADVVRALPDQTPESVKDAAVAASSPARKEERPAPVCAAHWAY